MLAFTLNIVLCTTLIQIDKNSKAQILKILKKTISNPLFISLCLAILFLLSGVKMPALLQKPIELIAQTAGPLSLIAIGGFIATHLELKKFKLSLLISLIKLTVFPTILFIIIKLFGIGAVTNEFFVVSVMQLAMPVAFSVLPLADEYDLDLDIVGSATIISSLMFLATSLVWLFLLNQK